MARIYPLRSIYMPSLGPNSDDHRRVLSSVLATELHRSGCLWVEPFTNRWHARRSPDREWVRGHFATTIRDHMLWEALDRLATQVPYSSWPELRSWRDTHSGKYEALNRVKRIWRDWAAPEDLPS